MSLELEPQLSKLSRHLPAGPGWVYEPKWDGFRALVAHLPGGVQLLSRRGRQLGQHYPELVELGPRLPVGSVLDGEIVAFVEGGLDFGALQYRLTLRQQRAKDAAAERPVSFVAFDLLRLAGEDLMGSPLAERRRKLEELVGRVRTRPLLDITPQTDSRELALRWLSRYMAAGIDGVVAKRSIGRYRPGERAWVKVKGERTVDAVVRGYIGAASQPRLVLGLYSADGTMHGIGSTYPLRSRDSEPLHGLAALARRSEHPIMTRWQSESFEGWTELPPRLVVEVLVTHVDQGRLRHSAHFRRWRFDRDTKSCTIEQLGSRNYED